MHLYVRFLNRFGGEKGYEGPKGPLFSETATYIIYLMPDLESAHFFDLEKLGLLLVISLVGLAMVFRPSMCPTKDPDTCSAIDEEIQ